MTTAKVFFTPHINPENLVKIYDQLGKKLTGKVAFKTHSGEPGGTNFLKPALMKDLVQKLNGTIVECNTAYHGKRFHTKDHEKAIKDHGFAEIAPFDIMDRDGDISLPIIGGQHLQENFVGKNLQNYDSILVLSHFKGHTMGGFGGALKNVAIGIASRAGKASIHSGGVTKDPDKSWNMVAEQEVFLECMVESFSSIAKFMSNELVYINVMMNLSVDCDCSATPEAPIMKDIGMLASLDPVALDKACLDKIYEANDVGRDRFVERVKTRNGQHTLDYAEKMGLGTQQYELVNLA